MQSSHRSKSTVLIRVSHTNGLHEGSTFEYHQVVHILYLCMERSRQLFSCDRLYNHFIFSSRSGFVRMFIFAIELSCIALGFSKSSDGESVIVLATIFPAIIRTTAWLLVISVVTQPILLCAWLPISLRATQNCGRC